MVVCRSLEVKLCRIANAKRLVAASAPRNSPVLSSTSVSRELRAASAISSKGDQARSDAGLRQASEETLLPEFATCTAPPSNRAAGHPAGAGRNQKSHKFGTQKRHVGSSPHPENINPDLWTDEFAFLGKPGEADIQTDLFYDYRTNAEAFPKWQEISEEVPTAAIGRMGAIRPVLHGRSQGLLARSAERRSTHHRRRPFRHGRKAGRSCRLGRQVCR
jgi:hypothetical protein